MYGKMYVGVFFCLGKVFAFRAGENSFGDEEEGRGERTHLHNEFPNFISECLWAKRIV